MSDLPIAVVDLTDADPLDGSEHMLVEQGDDTVRSTVQDVADLAPNPITVVINNQDANYTTVMDDAGKVIRVTAEADITIPAEASVDYPVGTVIGIRSATTSAVTVVEDTGVTVNIEAGLTLDLRGQYAEVSLHKVGADTWEAVGGFAEDES